MFVGNSLVKERFLATVAQDRIHAFLVLGPEHVGKTRLVHELACIRLGRSLRPIEQDVVRLFASESGARLTLEMIHGLIAGCAQGALEPRTISIEGADRLTPEAANALLVFLEHPPQRTVIVLTARSAESVIPTIRSRCVPFVLGPVSQDELRAGLTSMRLGVDASLMEEAIKLSDGLPGIAVRAIQDQHYRRSLRTMAALAAQWETAATLSRLKLAAKIAERPGQARALLERLSQTATVAHKPELLLALRRLNRNVQPRAVLEAYAMVSP